ncbi:MAG: DivIVA domain-containing protein [Actinobacteria bacterium]|nr:DivIVA domain-containing protein [Actinomycetota bacterium]
MDIHHKEFSTVRVGGYNKEEVDSFLDMVADELDRLLHRNQEQAELIESMREKVAQFDSMQQTLQNALINAQKSADNIVQEARIQAEAQIREAQERSLRILEEAKAERERILQSYSGIREQVLRYIATIREMLDKNQGLIREYEARLASAEVREAVPERPAAATEAPGMPDQQPPAGIAGYGAKETRPVEESPVQPPVEEGMTPVPDKGPASPGGAAAPPFAAPVTQAETIPEPRFEPPPPGPTVTPEQEIEMLERSLRKERREEETPRPPEAPPREEKEKHFFWE